MAVAGLVAVTNTTPVVALVGVGEQHLLEELFERVVVPADVWTELEDKPGAPEPAALLSLRNIVVLPARTVLRRIVGGVREKASNTEPLERARPS